MDSRLRLRDHRLEQVFHFERERYQLQASQLRLHENLPFPSGIDGFGIQLLLQCDGRRTVQEILDEAAARHEIDADEMIPTALASIRSLVVRGFLLPVDFSGD